MGTQTYIGTLQVVTCGGCGTTFGMEERVYEARRNDHKSFWCPNGCQRHFTAQSEAEKLRAQLAREEGRVAQLRYDAERAENRRRAQKAVTTKLKNRIAKGVCPCCKRHFANVQRHIENQHPDFTEATVRKGEDES